MAAAAELRAVWQRTANRCFVQEDAKRAPKFACCQSSCATSKLIDAGPTANAHVNVTTFNPKSSFSNQSPDPRWWLHLQPNCGFEKGLTQEQLYALQDEVHENKTYKGDGDDKHDSSDYMHYDLQADIMKKTPKDPMQEAFSELMDTMEIDSVGFSVSKQTNDFPLDSDYSWVEIDKAQPWWRTTDRDDLASFVSQKSLNHFENCDLPPPQKKYLRGEPCANIIDDKIKAASFDWEAKSSGFSNPTVQAKANLDSGLMHRKQEPSTNKGHLYSASGKSSSYTTIHDDVTEQVFEGDPSKAQLMEALCHSQTRAREAEEVAKLAYAEKEHLIALFFKQGSQLFAYKQWFRLLQPETLHVRMNKDKPISTPFEGRKPRKRKHKFANAEHLRPGTPKNDLTTYAVAFALGLSLVGAGLLLGWTVGWMLPRL